MWKFQYDIVSDLVNLLASYLADVNYYKVLIHYIGEVLQY